MDFRTLAVLLVATVFFVFAPHQAHAQDEGGTYVTTKDGDIRIELTGGIQFRTSYGWLAQDGDVVQDRFGFGMRRSRFRMAAEFGPKASFFLQTDASASGLIVLDILGIYQLTPTLRIRAGRFPGAQPRGFIPTGMPVIDGIGRAAVEERWARRTLGGDGRDFGIDLQWSKDGTVAELYLHNGDGNWGRANFTPDISVQNVTGGVEQTSFAVSASVRRFISKVDGLEMGVYGSVNNAKNPNTRRGGQGRNYFSYSGYVYWGALPGSQPLRLKSEIIGINYESPSDAIAAQDLLGYYVLGAVRVAEATEVFLRLENDDPNLDVSDDNTRFLSMGSTRSFSALRGMPFDRNRVTIAYSLANTPEGTPNQHLLNLEWQLWF